MRLDLAERLRCPRAHAATPLVVVASEVVERDLIRGVAGCPTCRYEARFEGGDLSAEIGGYLPRSTIGRLADRAPDAATLDRLIALLALDDASGAVLLAGRHGESAAALAAHCGVAVVVDGDRGSRRPEDPVCAILGFEEAVPFSDGTFRAAALDLDTTPGLAREVVRVTRVGGRVVGPVGLALPSGLEELARDANEWVAEVAAAATIVGLSRRDPRRGSR